MIRPLAKLNLGIILKNTSIATVLIFGLAQTAEADETKKHQDLYIACNPGINLSSQLNCGFNSQSPAIEQGTDTQIAQGKRGRRRKSKVDGYYGGVSLGVINPSGVIDSGVDNIPDVDYGLGFAGSVFGGIKFNKTIGAELEFLLGFGNGNADDYNNALQDSIAGTDLTGDISVEADYSAFAIYASPRFDLPLSEKLSLFITPGIGLSQTNVNQKGESNLAVTGSNATPENQATIEQLNGLVNQDIDQSTTGFSFKIKAGAEYLITDSIGIFGQATYVTLPVDDASGADSLNSLLAQGGLKFNF